MQADAKPKSEAESARLGDQVAIGLQRQEVCFDVHDFPRTDEGQVSDIKYVTRINFNCFFVLLNTWLLENVNLHT